MAGTFVGSISGVTFHEWDITNDMEVPSGRCVIINSASLNVQVQ
jgi:hypothetical protein